jgi:hypothetical protein
MDLEVLLGEPETITIVCKNEEELKDCRVELLRQSKLFLGILEDDKDVKQISLPLVEKETLQLVYEFWIMNHSEHTKYRPIQPSHFEVADIEMLVTPLYHQWVSRLKLHQLTSLLCTANYLQDDNLVNLAGAYTSIKLRCCTFQQIKDEQNLTTLPSKEEIIKVKLQIDPPPPPKKSKRKQTNSKKTSTKNESLSKNKKRKTNTVSTS